jgi:hypothetical protein
MMTFNQFNEATNSIKPVIIHKRNDRTFMLYTPEGRLLDDFTSAGPFMSFEDAKRNAEANVGVTMKLADF